MVKFDSPIIFVSNENPYGDESFLGRVHVVCADRAWADDVEEVWVCKPKEEVNGVAEEENVVDLVEEEGSDNEEENGNKENETPNIG